MEKSTKAGLLYKESYRITPYQEHQFGDWRKTFAVLASRIVDRMMTMADIKNVFNLDASNIDEELKNAYHFQYGCEPTNDEAVAFLASEYSAITIKSDMNHLFQLTMQKNEELECYQYDCELDASKYLKDDE